jgi:hypothetical protein
MRRKSRKISSLGLPYLRSFRLALSAGLPVTRNLAWGEGPSESGVRSTELTNWSGLLRWRSAVACIALLNPSGDLPRDYGVAKIE